MTLFPRRPFRRGLSICCVTGLLVCCIPEARAQVTPALEVVINEIAWMGTSTSTADEWIELFNNTPGAINLAGWTLTAADGTPTINLSGSIPAEATFSSSAPTTPACLESWRTRSTQGYGKRR